MPKQQDAFREELRAAGKMTHFKGRVKQLRDDGMPKTESWLQAAKEYGYRDQPDEPDDTEDSEHDPRITVAQHIEDSFNMANNGSDGSPSCLPPVIAFALDNLHAIPNPYRPDTWLIEPGDAPSRAAWNYLMMAVANQATFLRIVTNEVRENHKQQTESHDKEHDDEYVDDPGIAEVEAMLEQYKSGSDTQ